MASGRQLLRKLSRELKLIHPEGKLKDYPAYIYLKNQFKQNKVTGKRNCRGENEVQHVGETYLTLLESVRKADELTKMYKGSERSVEESARIVGLTLPKVPNNS